MEQVVVSDGFTMYVGDVLDCLRSMPDQSVHMTVTSPPYFQMRDYQVEGQLGMEETVEEYVENLVTAFSEVRRVMRDDATLWLNLGDGYQDKNLLGVPWSVAFALRAGGWVLRSEIIWNKMNPMPSSVRDRPTTSHEHIFLLSKKPTYFYDKQAVAEPAAWERWGTQFNTKHEGNGGGAGWIKTLTKTQIMEKIGPRRPRPDGVEVSTGGGNQAEGTIPFDGRTRNKRTVWTFPTQSYKGSHYATFPEKLAETCILAGSSVLGCCPKCGKQWNRIIDSKASQSLRHSYHGQGIVPSHRGGGDRPGGYYPDPVRTLGFEPTCECNEVAIPSTVLDPFIGSGTTAQVARSLGRKCIGIDLDRRNLDQAIERYNTPTREEKKSKIKTKARKPKVAQLSLDIE